MALNDPLDFDSLEPVEIPVRICGKNYLLKEAVAGTIIDWRNAGVKSSRVSGDGLLPGDDYFNTQITLVASCLYTEDGKTKVGETFVKSLTNRVFEPLLERLRQISGLDQDTEESLNKQILTLTEKRNTLRKARLSKPESTSREGTSGN